MVIIRIDFYMRQESMNEMYIYFIALKNTLKNCEYIHYNIHLYNVLQAASLLCGNFFQAILGQKRGDKNVV